MCWRMLFVFLQEIMLDQVGIMLILHEILIFVYGLCVVVSLFRA